MVSPPTHDLRHACSLSWMRKQGAERWLGCRQRRRATSNEHVCVWAAAARLGRWEFENEICSWCGVKAEQRHMRIVCGTCRRKYCRNCLLANYQYKETERIMNMKDSWHCFTCQAAAAESQARTMAARKVRARCVRVPGLRALCSHRPSRPKLTSSELSGSTSVRSRWGLGPCRMVWAALWGGLSPLTTTRPPTHIEAGSLPAAKAAAPRESSCRRSLWTTQRSKLLLRRRTLPCWSKLPTCSMVDTPCLTSPFLAAAMNNLVGRPPCEPHPPQPTFKAAS